jgi:ArsR family transcriptional regulator, arsenate/arsenite/antimonite-responsive transcriptional repressor
MIDVCRFLREYQIMPASTPASALLETTACCAPLNQSPLTAAEADGLARQLKALAEPARLRLLSLVMAAPDGEACTCRLTGPLGLSQPTVSHHLKKLAEAGLVTGERRGVWTYYRVNVGVLAAAARVLDPASTR